MATVRVAALGLSDLVSADEWEAVETITDTAFWQLMLVDDLGHARFLVELLVASVWDRLYAIVDNVGDSHIAEAHS